MKKLSLLLSILHVLHTLILSSMCVPDRSKPLDHRRQVRYNTISSYVMISLNVHVGRMVVWSARLLYSNSSWDSPPRVGERRLRA